MVEIPTWLPVVALALSDPEGRLLLQQRPADKHHGGLWEFPGGKVQGHESPRNALVREIAEELDIEIAPASLSASLVADEGGDPAIVLILYTSHQWRGEPVGREGQKWGWFTLAQAASLPLAPMDRDFLARLAL